MTDARAGISPNQALLHEVYGLAKETTVHASYFPPTKGWKTARISLTINSENVDLFEDNEELVFIGPSGGGAVPVEPIVLQGECPVAIAILNFVLGIMTQASLARMRR